MTTNALILSAIAVVVIGILEAVAIAHNVDGADLGVVITAIGGIVGYQVSKDIHASN